MSSNQRRVQPNIPTRGVGHWLPQDHKVIKHWLGNVIKHVDANPTPLKPVMQEFKQLIEGDSTLYMLFTAMFDEIPLKKPYFDDPVGHRQIRDYTHMLQLFNHLLETAPGWSDAANTAGLVGFPFNAVLDWPMGTSSGYAAFLNEKVNAQFKKMFDVWTAYLQTLASASVLSTESDGWFGPDALAALTAKGDDGLTTDPPTFEQLYPCKPNAQYYGFTSWDNFFTRPFNQGMRPIASFYDDTVIVNACESAPYRLAHNVMQRERFWIKSQPYSLTDMLANDPFAERFVGGTVYQAFLSALSYHRWHTPVSGKIVKAYIVPGTYYSEPLAEGFRSGHPDPSAPNNSQGYITAVATRAIIFIQADNPDLGLVCMMPVGMAEVSTCEIQVKEGQHVSKGDQLGMFHFGGSTHCLFFEKGVNLTWIKETQPPYDDNQPNIPVLSKIAAVGPKSVAHKHQQ